MTYKEALDYLYSSHPVFHLQGGAAYKPGLENVSRLLESLGAPQETFKSVHVAGTNGKGSTSHMLAAILQSSGKRTGLFTSPHLVDFRERIRIDGEMISKDRVVEFVECNRSLLERVKPSFFETTFAMAMWWFAYKKVDIAVVEVGLGGRLDATNILRPILSIVTNIGLDHTEYLGETLEAIAGEKAGIFKNGVPAVVGEASGIVREVFINKAHEVGCAVYFAEDNHSYLEVPKCQLEGEYQMKNIKTVLVAVSKLEDLGVELPVNALCNGLQHVCDLTGLQGRWQTIERDGRRLILDTGHNSHGIRTYVEQLKVIKDLNIVFGMVADKDIKESLRLLPKHAKYFFTQAKTLRAVSADDMRCLGVECGLDGETYETVDKAIEAAMKDEKAVVFIGGSNYVVGEALVYLS